MPEIQDNQPYLDRLRASAHGPEWFRDRLICFVATDDHGATERLGKAFKTVVEVTSAPFLNPDEQIYAPVPNNLIASASMGQDKTGLTIARNFRKYSDEEGIAVSPHTQMVDVSRGKRAGLYLGTALFIPTSERFHAADRRGDVEMVSFNHDEKPLSRMVPTFLGLPTHWAGWFSGQDRLCFGFSDVLPVRLVDTKTTQKTAKSSVPNGFNGSEIFVVMPPGPGARPAVKVLSLCKESAEHIRSSAVYGETAPIMSLVSREPMNFQEMTMPIVFDPMNEVGRADLSSVLGASTSKAEYVGNTARLTIRPNSAMSRLRHVPDALKDWGYFSIVGLLVPSPQAIKSVKEVVVLTQSSQHLMAHGIDSLTSATLFSSFGSLTGFRDRAVTALNDGTSQTVILNRTDDLEPLNAQFGVTHLSRAGVSGIVLRNPALGSSTAIEGALSGGEFYLFRRNIDQDRLGYFACPLPPRAAPSDLENQDYQPCPVTFDRMRPVQHAVCLDWLDDAAQVISEFHTAGGQRVRTSDRLGYAKWWQTHVGNMKRGLDIAQAIELRPTQSEAYGAVQRYALTLTEGVGDTAQSAFLENGDHVRLGPLICRWTAPDGS